MPIYKQPQYEVTRRFSDFLGLYQKLAAKHLAKGLIVPLPPEKSIVGVFAACTVFRHGHILDCRQCAYENGEGRGESSGGISRRAPSTAGTVRGYFVCM